MNNTINKLIQSHNLLSHSLEDILRHHIEDTIMLEASIVALVIEQWSIRRDNEVHVFEHPLTINTIRFIGVDHQEAIDIHIETLSLQEMEQYYNILTTVVK